MIAFLGLNGSFSFNRNYVLGYQFFHDGNLALLSRDETHINLGYLYPFLEFDFVILSGMSGTRSNNYTLNHSFDFPSSGCLLNGSPTAAGVFVHFNYAPGEYLPRLQIDFGFSHTHDIFIDLPKPLSAWFVRP